MMLKYYKITLNIAKVGGVMGGNYYAFLFEIYKSILLIDFCLYSLSKCVYIDIVVCIFACPACCIAVITSTPARYIRVINVCRSQWGVICGALVSKLSRYTNTSIPLPNCILTSCTFESSSFCVCAYTYLYLPLPRYI